MTDPNPYEPTAVATSHVAHSALTRHSKFAFLFLVLAFLMALNSLPNAVRGFYILRDWNNLRFIAMCVGCVVLVAFCAYSERYSGRRMLLALPFVMSPLLVTAMIAVVSLAKSGPRDILNTLMNDPMRSLELMFLFAVLWYAFLTIRRSVGIWTGAQPLTIKADG